MTELFSAESEVKQDPAWYVVISGTAPSTKDEFVQRVQAFCAVIVPTTSLPLFLGILGGIGVGKTGLLERARTAGFFVSPELVNMRKLKRYIRRGNKHLPGAAMEFQEPMLATSWQRVRDAYEKMGTTTGKRTVFLERPGLENIIFAYANYRTGRMTQAEWRRYKREALGWLEAVFKDVADPTTIFHRYFYLHLNEAPLTERRQKRDREAERGYDQPDEEGAAANSDLDETEAAAPAVEDHYLAHLMDGYMAFFCEASLRLQRHEIFQGQENGWVTTPGALAVPVVVDWTEFGEPAEILGLATTVPDRTKNISLCIGLVTPPPSHGGVNLGHYWSLPVNDDEAIKIRDDFFTALAQGQDVHLLLANAAETDMARERWDMFG